MDYSTLNTKRLALLPVHKMPPSYHYQTASGNGCAGDPPGYPTYFTRNVWTSHGNCPGRGARLVISHPTLGDRVVAAVDDSHDDLDYVLGWLWVPLPYDHPRVVAWRRTRYKHFAHCFVDNSRFDDCGHGPKMVFWPDRHNLNGEPNDLFWERGLIKPENHKAF